ncbi:MAG: IS1595 family transposase [Ginsengibacter sp.]
MFKGMNILEFTQKFPDKESCYRYLEEIKWGNGFKCSRCGHDECYKGKHAFSRRCKSCAYEESVTANTLFHGIKMSILKAFHLAFRISAKKKGMSTVELGHEVGIQQKSAWLFKRKTQVGMQSDKKNKIETQVHVDEFVVGGKEPGKPGRSLSAKKATMIVMEKIDEKTVGRVYLQQIENYEADTLKYAIKEHVGDEALITTDQYPSYQSLKSTMGNLITQPSEKGKNFKQLHEQIMLFKIWLRGIHHKCSSQHYQAYLDEYCYRFNRRGHRKNIFDNLIRRMMNQIPHPYPVLKKLCDYST